MYLLLVETQNCHYFIRKHWRYHSCFGRYCATHNIGRYLVQGCTYDYCRLFEDRPKSIEESVYGSNSVVYHLVHFNQHGFSVIVEVFFMGKPSYGCYCPVDRSSLFISKENVLFNSLSPRIFYYQCCRILHIL